MNKDLLDFWGNLFITTAKTQRQMEEMAQWSRGALSSLMEWTASFQKQYGIEAFKAEEPHHSNAWNRMDGSCQKFFLDEWLRFWGMKPSSDDHLRLIRRYEELKEKLVLQEETIRHLRLLLDEAKREKRAKDPARDRQSKKEAASQWTETAPSCPT